MAYIELRYHKHLIMTIDIKRTVIRTQFRRFLTLIAVTVLIITVILLGSLGKDLLGMNKYSWALIIGLLYVISLVAESLLELNYIYYNDDKEKIILRYFSMSVFSRRKNSIEIPKSEFGGYELKEAMWGLKPIIVLLHRFNEKDARYPEVSLSGLSKNELQLLLKSLDKWKIR